MYTNAGSNRSYSNIGVAEGHHNLSHHGNDEKKQSKIAQINAFHVQQLAYFLEKLQSTKEHDGSLLDNCMVMYGSGISDGNPSFLRYSLGFGVGGYVPLACRPNDRFGIAWFYNELSDELGPIVSVLVNPQNESGVEIFYNIEVTPSFHLTPDLQILNPALARGDAAILFALRAKIDF